MQKTVRCYLNRLQVACTLIFIFGTQIIVGFSATGSTYLGHGVSQNPQSDFVLGGVPHSRSTQSALAQTKGPSDPVELEDFLENEISAELNDYHIPGAAVSVVRNGQLFLAKGYGYADLQNNKPAVADQTLFMVGSVTKLFTFTAEVFAEEDER